MPEPGNSLFERFNRMIEEMSLFGPEAKTPQVQSLTRDATHFRRIIAAASSGDPDFVRSTVHAARDAGERWIIILVALGVASERAQRSRGIQLPDEDLFARFGDSVSGGSHPTGVAQTGSTADVSHLWAIVDAASGADSDIARAVSDARVVGCSWSMVSLALGLGETDSPPQTPL